jgi:hypothetical protein
MRRIVLLMVVLAASVPGVASAATGALTGEWNRLSSAPDKPAPEHERLMCMQSSNGGAGGSSLDDWRCRYNKVPESSLNFFWDQNQGFLQGHDVTATWSCPAWFPAAACANVNQVVEGTMTFFQPSLHPPFPVLEDLIVSQTPTGQVLYIAWVNQFVCPWYRTWDDALAANPFPLPFNGTDRPPQDCVNAP